MNVKSLVYVAVMAALITVCAWITIPTAVPFTLQTFAIFLAAGVLGGRLASLAVGVYLLLGAVGLPVFSGFSGGIGRFAGVTGGYLIGFLVIPLVMWGAQALFGRGPVVFVLSGIVGLAVNDNVHIRNYAQVMENIRNAFEHILPEKSSFEQK